jgi:hypothetical protein
MYYLRYWLTSQSSKRKAESKSEKADSSKLKAISSKLKAESTKLIDDSLILFLFPNAFRLTFSPGIMGQNFILPYAFHYLSSTTADHIPFSFEL